MGEVQGRVGRPRAAPCLTREIEERLRRQEEAQEDRQAAGIPSQGEEGDIEAVGRISRLLRHGGSVTYGEGPRMRRRRPAARPRPALAMEPPAPLLYRVPALLLLGLAACPGPEPAGPDVLLIVVDTLRQDRLEPYGDPGRPTSPALLALAEEAVTVEGLTSSSSWTTPSVATLFTGLAPAGHRMTRIEDRLEDPETLAARFRAAGYRTACVMTNPILRAEHARSWGWGLQQGFERWDNALALRPEPHRGITSGEVTERGLAWIREEEDGRPWFLVLHYFDPHLVYEDHPDLPFEDPDYEGWVQGGASQEVLRRHQAETSAADRRQLRAYYDEEVRGTDDAVGKLLSALRREGRLEDTLVVFTADHGEELAERGVIGHNHSLHTELIDLPLLVRLPGGEGGGRRLRCRLPLRDLYATILDLAGLPVPEGRGRSFAPVLRGEAPAEDRVCFSEVDFVPPLPGREEKRAALRSVIAGGWKLVENRRLPPGDPGRYRLFDLEADPGELRDRSGDPAQAARMDRLRALLESEPAWFR